MSETDIKAERLARFASKAGIDAILLSTQANFAWLTGGAANRIDGSREPGAGTLMIAADGRRFVLANRIEMPRLTSEALTGLSFEPIEFAWADEHADAALVAALARSAVGSDAQLASDWPLADTISMEADIARLRAPLTWEEIDRYRQFGREAGVAVGEWCRGLNPGMSESDIAGHVNATMARMGARAIVTLVGADERIARYRHPVPGPTEWRRTVLVGLCAERAGLVVALSRIICTNPVEASLGARTRATADVFARLLRATLEGETGGGMFACAAHAYVEAGFPGEEQRHHQGGAIGYQSRDWIAHPRSTDVAQLPQAFAWTPSITGTKVEDTALMTSQGVELVTSSPGWPSLERRVGAQTIAVSDVLVLDT